jgi:hypothetical protein
MSTQTETLTAGVTFNQELSMCFVDSRTGALFQIPEENAKIFYGKIFTGKDFYQGNFLPSVNKIRNPILFITIEDFLNVTLPPGCYEEKSRRRLRDNHLKSLECVVIADREEQWKRVL